MIAEFNIGGVLLSSMLAAVVAALLGTVALRRLLAWTGAYRLIWHPALFDAGLFVILWAIAIAVPSPFGT